jgi:hypothetical protein
MTNTPLIFIVMTACEVALKSFMKRKNDNQSNEGNNRVQNQSPRVHEKATNESQQEHPAPLKSNNSKFSDLITSVRKNQCFQQISPWIAPAITALAVKVLNGMPAMNGLAIMGTTFYAYASASIIKSGCEYVNALCKNSGCEKK